MLTILYQYGQFTKIEILHYWVKNLAIHAFIYISVNKYLVRACPVWFPVLVLGTCDEYHKAFPWWADRLHPDVAASITGEFSLYPAMTAEHFQFLERKILESLEDKNPPNTIAIFQYILLLYL